MSLVLSIFPGIDLLGRAFEEEGYCVVRGPDVIWGGDVRAFHPPAGMFEGVIGGPPCQAFSALRHLIRHNGHEPRFGNLIPEYERVVFEAQPSWFLMENVPDAPIPQVEGYHVYWFWLTDQQAGGVQPRKRRFTFGSRDGRMLYLAHCEVSAGQAQSVCADGRQVPVKMLAGGRVKRSIVADSDQGTTGSRVRGGGKLPHGESRFATAQGTRWNPEKKRPEPTPASVMGIADACEAMGLPRDFTDHMPFTVHGKRSVIGNGVPMAMGRAVAQAVQEALHDA